MRWKVNVMTRIIAAITLLAVALGAWEVDAAGWRGLPGRRTERAVPADTLFYGPVTGPGTHAHVAPWQYYRGKYPRYFGAFHARELQNLGVPSGDIGLRGNGIFWSPW